MDNHTLNRSRKIQIQISDSLNNKLSSAANRCGVTKSAFVRVALEREFANDQQLAAECAQVDGDRKWEQKEGLPQPLLFEI